MNIYKAYFHTIWTELIQIRITNSIVTDMVTMIVFSDLPGNEVARVSFNQFNRNLF